MKRYAEVRYTQPDLLAHVYCFAYTEEAAAQIAHDANRHGLTRNGKFVAGSFRVEHLPGRMPAVVGDLTGEEGAEK